MFLFGLNACLNCGSFVVQRGLLCAFCEAQLLEADFCGLELSTEKNLRVLSLFDWAPQQSDTLSRLLLALKGSKKITAWQHWANYFWLQKAPSLSQFKKIIFIPAASTTGKSDHAFHFAMALADICAGEVLNILEKTTKAHQRTKNRDQRSGVSIRSHVKIAAKSKEVLYILVDDVLTTGSTALSSYEALGRPANFEVWVLAKRGLYCELLVDLI